MRLLSTVLAAALVVACNSPALAQPNPDRAAWTEAGARWEATRPERYAYTLNVSCECSWPVMFSVVVAGTDVESVAVPPEHLAMLNADEFAREFARAHARGPRAGGLTVETLFARIDRAISAGNPIGVTYDAAFGFPVETQTNVVAARYDASRGYSISHFTPLP